MMTGDILTGLGIMALTVIIHAMFMVAGFRGGEDV